LENLVKRYVIVGNESQIIRELATRKPLMISQGESAIPVWEPKGNASSPADQLPAAKKPAAPAELKAESLSLLEIGRRAAMAAERDAIERALNETRWNRRQAAKLLKVSYKALLNKMKIMEEQDLATKQSSLTK